MSTPWAEKVRRFWAKVAVSAPSECWLWRGRRDGTYPSVCWNGKYGKYMIAHRLAWELARGPIPSGLCVLHRCDTPRCVNPNHLFLGTVAENNLDKLFKGRCAYGDRNGARTHPETHPRGERHGRAKLSAGQVAEIRARVAAGETKAAMARCFGVGFSTVGSIVAGRTWVNL